MRIILANPRGFCAGVNMAIECLDGALQLFGSPVYVFHEIVHNKTVVEEFRSKGAVFVEDVEQVPPGSTLLFSAHGVSPAVRSAAAARRLNVIDATCPLVAKVHSEAVRFARRGHRIFFIGHEGHDESIGTLGEAPERITLVQSADDVDSLDGPPGSSAYLTQTTLSVDDARRIIARLRERFPDIVAPPSEDICYATQNRQQAVRRLAPEADVVLVLGSQNSSNSRRLAEIAAEMQVPAYLIDSAADIDLDWFTPTSTVLITAGASAPEILVSDCVEFLVERYEATVEQRTFQVEDVRFQQPVELRRALSAQSAQ